MRTMAASFPARSSAPSVPLPRPPSVSRPPAAMLARAAPRSSFLASAAPSRAALSVACLSSALVASAFSPKQASCSPAALHTVKRFHHTGGLFTGATRTLLSPKAPQQPSEAKPGSANNQLQGVSSIDRYREEQEEEQRDEQQQDDDPFNKSSGPGYLPFPPPFHTINVIMILFIANVLCYLLMNFGNDDLRDFIVEHFTLSHENFHKVYPVFTNALYQENMLQLLIDCWLLWQFGDTMLAFLGNVRLTFFCFLCTLGGSLIHVARQKFELHYGMDELEVRGRCYGPNPMIMGLISMEGLIFRHLNFIQQPPIPFLVLTAFVMVIDVWRIFTTRPEEHGAATGGALMAYLFWALPTRFLGLDKLTATM